MAIWDRMMTEGTSVGLTPRQSLILWGLVARGGVALQKNMTPKPEAADRVRLVGDGLLLQSRQRRGAIALELTDLGWAWARGNTTAPLPRQGNAAAFVLADLLARLGAFLDTTGTPLADFIHPPATEPPRQPVPAVQGDGNAHLPERLRTAYLAESGGELRRRVRLAAIRARLADVGRGEMDAALVALELAGDGGTLPFDDPADITEADRAAALRVGGTNKHILWLDR